MSTQVLPDVTSFVSRVRMTRIAYEFLTVRVRSYHFNTGLTMFKNLGDIHRLKLFTMQTINAIRFIWKGRNVLKVTGYTYELIVFFILCLIFQRKY